jgi:putative flippase GtrA
MLADGDGPAQVAAAVAGKESVSALLFLLMRQGGVGAGVANAVALAATAVGSTAANRRLTFGVMGRRRLVRQHAAGAVVFAITLGLTAGALDVLHGVAPGASRGAELAVLVAASLAATVTRYVALKTLVFAGARRARIAAPDRNGELHPSPRTQPVAARD